MQDPTDWECLVQSMVKVDPKLFGGPALPKLLTRMAAAMKGQNQNSVLSVAADRAVYYLTRSAEANEVIKTLDKTAGPVISESYNRCKKAESDDEGGDDEADDLPASVRV
eukprot:scaffold1761_cov357-Prasinococcus_capsulatus_cf.AAC.16